MSGAVSLYVVEREEHAFSRAARHLRAEMLGRYPTSLRVPEIRDCNEHDGEWPAFITLPHEHVEHEGYGVPAFEGDVERQEWEARR